MTEQLTWMLEKVPEIKGHNLFYKLVCFFTFRVKRKMNYRDLFLLYYGLHRNKLGEKKSKEKALKAILKIYKDNNGKLPEGI